MVAVGAGGYWLLRTPPAPPEAALPRASTTTAVGAQSPPSTVAVAQTSPATSVLVHVAGAVVRPGVYELPAGARVADAIAAAGGAAADGDPDLVNLAAPVVDGQRLSVPRIGDTVAPDPGPASTASAAPAGPIDVNSAGPAELETLPGIGPATAAAIVRHREQNGPFPSVDALLDVPGIGPAKLDAFRSLVTV